MPGQKSIPDTCPSRRLRSGRLVGWLAFLALVGGLLLAGCTPGEGAAYRAVTQLGRPYVYGGASPASGFDCSGLVMWSWKMAGKQLPRTAAQQHDATYPISHLHVHEGDLAFYQVGGRITHVAMYVGRYMLIMARKPGYNVELHHVGWWASHFVGYRRVR